MVTQGRARLGAAVILVALLGGTRCKVVNEDHCANQDIPGNVFCQQLSTAAPYCSPCRREFHGCVDFEPFACPGYSNELEEDSDAPTGGTPTDGEPSGTGMGTDPGTGPMGSSGSMTSG